MNRVITLTKTLLKTGEGFGFSNNSKSKSKIKKMLIPLLLLACFIPMGITFGKLIAAPYDALAQIEQQGMILGFGLSVVSFMIFFFGIFFIMTVFYFSMDIENLLPLPLKPSEIVGAKFTTVLVYEYLTELLFLLPVVIAYGIKSSGGILFYLYSFVIFLILPVIPLIVAGLIVMVIMRFSNIAKNKDRFKVIGGVIAMFVGVGVNLGIQKMANNTNQEELVRLFSERNNSLVNLSSKIFPSSKLAVNSLINSNNLKGIINLMLFVVISAALVFIFILLGEMLYFKGVMGISETVSKRKKLSSSELDKRTTKKSPLKANISKELKLLFRTPAYFLNCILMNFLWPVLLIVPLIMQGQNINELKKLGIYFQTDSKYAAIILAVGFGSVAFVALSNNIATTAISREGKKLFVLKYIPVKIKTQLMAKVLSGVIMGCVSLIMMLLPVIILIRPSIYLLIMIVVLGLLGIVFVNFVGIFIDLNSPKLNWDNEQKAVKQNMNVMASMIVCVLIVGASIFGVIKLDLSVNMTFILILLLYGILDGMLYYLLCTKGVKMFKDIQA